MSNYYNRQWRLPNNENKDKQSNYSMDFSGSGDKITLDSSVNSVLSTGMNPFSFSIWFNVDSVSNSYNEFFGYGQVGVGLSGVRVYGGVFKHNSVNNPYGQDLNSTTVIQTGQWYHGAVTFDGTTRRIYVNGVEEASDTPTFTILPNSSYPLTIGVYPSRTKYTYGKLDAACFFNYALSSSQVTTLYGSSSTGIGNPMSLSPKPVAYYPLGDQDAFNGANYLVPNASLQDYVFNGIPGGTKLINSNINQSNTGGKFTISFWQKRSNAGIIHFNHGGTGIGQFTSYSNRPIVFLASDYFQYFDVPTVEIGVWKHYVVFMDASDVTNSKLWVNGTSIAQSTSHTTGQANSFTSGLQLNLDRYPEISNMMYFTNYEINQTNVDVLYNNGYPITSTSGLSTAPDHWWKLDASDTYDSSTGNWTIEDHVGSTNGTSSGMTQANLVQSDLSFTSGYSPYALDFDGTNDYIGTTTGSITGNDARSMSFWYKTTSSSAMIPFSIGNPSSPGVANSQFGYCINNGSPTQAAVFAIATNDVTPITGVPATNDGNWHHVVVSWSGSVLSLYIDGTEYATPQPAGNYNTTAGFKMGGWGNNDRRFNGSISNCSVWNAALTSSQVSEIYNEGVPSNLNNHSAYLNLVSWWQLGSNSSFNTNWTVLDEKGSNNGTSSNMTEDDIVDGVGSYANGLSSGMGGDEVIGDAPYSSSNSLSVNMDVLDRVEDTPA
jgi:hypothetical protein